MRLMPLPRACHKNSVSMTQPNPVENDQKHLNISQSIDFVTKSMNAWCSIASK